MNRLQSLIVAMGGAFIATLVAKILDGDHHGDPLGDRPFFEHEDELKAIYWMGSILSGVGFWYVLFSSRKKR